MHTPSPILRDRKQRFCNQLAGLVAGSALAIMAGATPALAQTETKEAEVCVLAGIDVPKAQDQDCPTDVLSALRAYYFEYEAPKLDEAGNPVIDAETGEAVMEVRKETFGLNADLLEAAGFGDALRSAPATVFALPDSVLAPTVKALGKALEDEAMRDEIMGQVAAAAGSHALNEAMAKSRFQNANGKVWTLAGGWQSTAAPLTFYALSGDGSVTVNGVMLDRTDIMAPDGSVIHTIARPLVALPQPAMEMEEKMAEKSS